MQAQTKKIMLTAVLVIAMALLAALVILVVQGKRTPRMDGQYVALGSSFAAGLGLGPRVSDSPLICLRSDHGYPQQLARMLHLSIVDMSCSGATLKHVWRGGQVFLGPQIDAIGPDTQLVTLTAGGNDVSYIGDLTMMAYKRHGELVSFLVDLFWKGAKSAGERDFAQLQSDMTATLEEITRRAPQAKIVLVTYPAILPSTGNCAQTGISDEQAALMREVATKFSEAQHTAARAANVEVIDMEALSVGHDACSPSPWVSGANPAHGAPFHPTLAGATAVALQVKRLFSPQAAVPAGR